jgi:hypothetical protein
MEVNDYSQFRAEEPLGYTAKGLPCSVKHANGFVHTDAWYTRDNILNGVNGLLQDTQASDDICIFFSDYGARIPSMNPSLWYEGMAVYIGGVVTDSDLATLANQLDYSHVNPTLVLDTCHSGGLHPVEDVQQTVSAAQGAISPKDVVQAFTQSCQKLVSVGFGLDVAEAVPGQNIRAIGLQNNECDIQEADDSHYVELAKNTLLSACAATEEEFWSSELEATLFVAALKSVLNASNFQSSNTDLLAYVRAGADRLMTQCIRSIPEYAQKTSVPQLYGR